MNRIHSLDAPISAIRRAASGAATFALLLVAGTAQAGDWQWSITPYGWLTDLGVEVEIDEREVVDETIAVGDLVEDLETIFQMRLEVRNGRFGIMTDLFDVTIADEVTGIVLPRGAGQADLDSRIGMTIFDLAGLYDPKGDGQGIAIIGGTRIINERADVEATYRPVSGSAVEAEYETTDTMVDALVGLRLTQRFTRHWAYEMQADVSAGGTDYTWSVGPSLSYAFGDLCRYAVSAGYRRLTIAFEDEGGMDARMTLSGFLLGLRTSF